jgi:hypothetical protein
MYVYMLKVRCGEHAYNPSTQEAEVGGQQV